MNTPKTAYVWVMIVIVILLVLLTGLNFILALGTNAGAITFLVAAVLLVSFLIQCTWLYKASKMKPELIKWTHILVGILALQFILAIQPGKVLSAIIDIAILALVWYTFTNHLKQVFGKTPSVEVAQ